MEIIIGAMPPLRPQSPQLPQKQTAVINAKLLHARPPRKGIAGPSGMERRDKKAKDPQQGRVLTLMVPDGTALPKDLDSANYEVSIRLVRRS